MRSLRILASIACLSCPWLACREPAAPAPPECPDGVAVVVTEPPGGPEFSWTPACPVGLLMVSTGDSGWEALADSNRILPPVRYGRQPAGSQSPLEPSAPPLAHGDTCTVSVARWYSSGLYQQVARLTFVY